jgi:GMP synthase (glutamine-hydrolysing)
VRVHLLPDAASDSLLGVLDGEIAAQQTHSESVLELPPGARRLAENDCDPNQAYALGENVWGVQFHPEFDADVVRAYLVERADALREEGLDPEAISDRVTETPAGPLLLRRFAALLHG